MIIKSKKGLEAQFAWLFAIIVGIFILVLTFFIVARITQTEQVALDASTAKEIGVLLNPLETGFETAKTTSIILPSETRIYNKCNNEEYFGRQIIKLSQKSFNKWTDTNLDVGFSNKYIFSDEFEEGKKFFIFSKPFEFPFKISDLIYLSSSDKKYCFDDAPKEISEELENLNQENIFMEECPENSIKVCFTETGCDVDVLYEQKYAIKNSERLDFETDSLMYAAIFSDSEVYECQVKRLMQRGEQLALLYKDKAEITAGKGCGGNLISDLTFLNGMFDEVKDSGDLRFVEGSVNDMQSKNKLCRLW